MENHEKEIIATIHKEAEEGRKTFLQNNTRALEKAGSISDLEEVFRGCKCPAVHRSSFSVDNIPLTRKQYDDAKKLIRETCEKENVENNKTYNQFRNKAKEKFKDILWNNSFSYKGKNKKEVFNVIFNRAWDEAHAQGLTDVSYEFDDLDDFVSDILQAANG